MSARNARADILLATSIVVVFAMVEVWLCNAAVAFGQPLWLDEVHTVLLSGRQSTAESLRSLAAGADFNPPLLFLLYRAVATLVGGLSEVVLRSVSMATIVMTIVIVYAVLRDTFDRGASAVGALTVWANSVVVAEAFDARFYGPWLLATACLALATRRRLRIGPTTAGAIGLALASIAVCTIHYFGILSWIGVVGTAWLATQESARARIRLLLPAVLGPAALAACIPLYLGQRAALSTTTWIPDLSLLSVLFLLVAAVLSPPIVVAAIAWGASRVLSRRGRPRFSGGSATKIALGPTLLLSQLIVPVALAVFSLAVQPAMQPRYTIAAALCGAPVVAFCYARMTNAFRLLTVATIVLSSVMVVHDVGAAAHARVRAHQWDMEQVAAIAGRDSTVVVRRRHSLYPILLERPDLISRVALFDETSVKPNDRFAMVERDVARVHERLYGFPRVVTREELRREGAFYFLETDSTRAPSAGEFPGRRIQPVGGRLYLLQPGCEPEPIPASRATAHDPCATDSPIIGKPKPAVQPTKRIGSRAVPERDHQ